MANNKWTDNLPNDVYLRLCECRNTKKDIGVLVNTRWAWMKTKEKYNGFKKEDALVYILELLDCNSQYEIADLTVDEYNELSK